MLSQQMLRWRVTWLADHYKRMSFGAGALSAEDLNQLVSNMDVLEGTMVKGHYSVAEIKKNTGLLIQGVVTGIVNPTSNKTRYAQVYWPRPFSTGCNPVIVGSRYESEFAPVSLSIRAIDGSLYPNNSGFRAEINLVKDQNLWWSSGKWSEKSTVYSFIGLGW